jgi:quinol monooxygenase YgiN
MDVVNRGRRTAMNKLEVSARMSIRDGKLDGFKQQAAEIIRLTREKDTKTLRYDWFINNDQTECEVREVYQGSEGLIEHRKHVGEAINKLFREFAEHHAVAIFGDASPELVGFVKAHKDVESKWYSQLGGLASG